MATTSTLAFREWTYTEQWQKQKQEQSDGSSSQQNHGSSGSIQALLWHSLSVNSSSSCLLLLFACTREGDLVVWNVSTSTNDDGHDPSTTLLRQKQQHLPLWKRQIVANGGALYAMAWLDDDKDKTIAQAQARRRLLVAGVGGIYVLDAARIVQECTTTTTATVTRPSSNSSAMSGDKDGASSCASIILAHCPTYPTPVPTAVTQMAVVVVVGDATTTTTTKAAAVYGVVPNDAFGAYQWNLDNNHDSSKKVVRTWPTTTTNSTTSRGARIAPQQHVTVTAVDALVTTTKAILEEEDRNVNNSSSNTDKDNNVLVAIGDSTGVVQIWKGSQVQTVLQLSPLEKQQQQQQQQRPVQACRFWNTTDWLVVVYGNGGGFSTSSGSGSASAMHRPEGQQQQKQRAGSLIVMWHVPTQHVVAQVSTAPTTVHCLHVTANHVMVGDNQGQVTVYTPCDLQHVCTVVSSSSSDSPCIHGIAATTTTLSLSSTDDSQQQKQWIAMAGVGNTVLVLDQDCLPWQTLQL